MGTGKLVFNGLGKPFAAGWGAVAEVVQVAGDLPKAFAFLVPILNHGCHLRRWLGVVAWGGGSRTVRGRRTEGRTGGSVSVPLGLAMAAQRESLERVIAEQAARIADLQAGLDHERAQARGLTEALAREKVLRALSAPAPEAAAPEAGRGAPEPQSNPPAPPEPPAPTFWERLGLTRRKAVQGSSEDGVN